MAMKKVGIREAQIKLTTLLDDLPFGITRYGKHVATVDKPERKNKYAAGKAPVTVTEKDTVTQPETQAQDPLPEGNPRSAFGLCQAPPRCYESADGLYRMVFIDPDKGEMKKEIRLCKKHYQKALNEGAEIEEIEL